MPYWQLLYHIVWATKDRYPYLTNAAAPEVYQLVRNKAIELQAKVLAINGIEDHVHLIVAIPPKLAIARFVGEIKGVSSRIFNQSGHPEAPIAWQDQYSVFSCDAKCLPKYLAYVHNQQQHHAEGSIILLLEETNPSRPIVDGVREDETAYILMSQEIVC